MQEYKESKEIEAGFKAELTALLLKWDAEIFVDNSGTNYGNDYNIECHINSKWEEGKCVSEYTNINLGTFIQ
jgi:hypothetical protein